jgi:hypothetical protein
MAKKLAELDAGKAGVNQAELTVAFDTLPILAKELDAADKAQAAALKAKKALSAEAAVAKESLREANAHRDGIFEEWQRAAWIVRNADPDQPPPALGLRPPAIKTHRS